jgi:uncharacterized membrane protein YeaQ/YmgE (transglycosylase-associated protein family)
VKDESKALDEGRLLPSGRITGMRSWVVAIISFAAHDHEGALGSSPRGGACTADHRLRFEGGLRTGRCRTIKRGGTMGLIWTIVVGFVVGVVAKFVHPGRDNMGFVMTTLLGIGGAFVATFLGQAVGWYQAGQGAGFISATLGAILILVVYGHLASQKSGG